MKTIHHVFEIAAPPGKIFAALTTTEGLSGWWTTKVSAQAEVGAVVDFTFGGDFNPDMRVTELDPPVLLGWECVGGHEPWAENTFRFELEEKGSGTVVRFWQNYARELSDDAYGTYNFNWGYYLESLRLFGETRDRQALPGHPMTPKDLILHATTELFGNRDLSAIDRHWAGGYIEHSAFAGPGLHGLREAAASLPAGFRHEMLRVLGEDELVVAHGLYHGLGAVPIVGCDLWRVADDKIVEHWDARQPWAGQPVSGHTMTGGPAVVTEPHKTAASKKLVEQFAELIMMGVDRTQITRFFDGDRFIQHNPLIADGVSGLGTAIQAGVWAAVVERVHHVVADGEFVFTQGEGILHGTPTAFYDLFRVENDKLAEHWDVVFAKPDTLPHGNGLF